VLALANAGALGLAAAAITNGDGPALIIAGRGEVVGQHCRSGKMNLVTNVAFMKQAARRNSVAKAV